MEKVKELTENDFDDFTKEGLSLIDFWASWCMPCLMMAPITEELSETFKGKIKFGKINTEEYPHIAQKYNIRAIPNFILFKDGEIADQFIGAMSAEDFEEKLKRHL